MSEEITDEQKELTEAAETTNDESLQQQANQAEDDIQQKAAAAIAQLNQKISELPKIIEEKIKEIRETLDTALFKDLDPTLDPDSINFDINSFIEKITAMADPLLKSILPIAGAIGIPVPVLGDIPKITQTMSQQAAPASELTKEEIQAMVPTKPEVPSSILKEIDRLVEDIRNAAIEIQTMFVDVAFKMIDVIYSKLQIITSVIPLGSFFPLNLLPNVKQAIPLAKKFATNAPSMMKKAAEGLVQDKMAEAQALGIPEVPSADSLKNAANSAAQSTAANATNAAADAAADVAATPAIAPVENLAPINTPSKELTELRAIWKPKFEELQYAIFVENMEDYKAGTMISNPFYDVIRFKESKNLFDDFIAPGCELRGLNVNEQVDYYYKKTYTALSPDFITVPTIVRFPNPKKYEVSYNDDNKPFMRIIIDDDDDDTKLTPILCDMIYAASEKYIKKNRADSSSKYYEEWQNKMQKCIDSLFKNNEKNLKSALNGLKKSKEFFDTHYFFNNEIDLFDENFCLKFSDDKVKIVSSTR